MKNLLKSSLSILLLAFSIVLLNQCLLYGITSYKTGCEIPWIYLLKETVFIAAIGVFIIVASVVVFPKTVDLLDTKISNWVSWAIFVVMFIRTLSYMIEKVSKNCF